MDNLSIYREDQFNRKVENILAPDMGETQLFATTDVVITQIGCGGKDAE